MFNQKKNSFFYFILSKNYSQKKTKKAHKEKKERGEITTGEAHFVVEFDNDNVVVKVDVKMD